MRQGYIYKITNDFNDKIYIGQTARDIETRFMEHCFETRGHSRLHNAIQKHGWTHFKVEEIESVPLSELDEREIYWIKYYDSTDKEKGYNIIKGGHNANFHPRDYKQILIKENNITFDSKEECARLISQTTSWSLVFLKDLFTKILDTDKDFCGYHLKTIDLPEEEISDRDCQIDWIKTLNIQYQGTKIYCEELQKEFETIGQAAKFCKDNDLCIKKGDYIINTIISAISNYIKNPTEDGISLLKGLHFYKMPGSTKNTGSKTPFERSKVYCPEIDKSFESQQDCAKYFLDNKIWTGIKLKTAKLRISDVICGVFSNYKGYTFQRIEE